MAESRSMSFWVAVGLWLALPAAVWAGSERMAGPSTSSQDILCHLPHAPEHDIRLEAALLTSDLRLVQTWVGKRRAQLRRVHREHDVENVPGFALLSQFAGLLDAVAPNAGPTPAAVSLFWGPDGLELEMVLRVQPGFWSQANAASQNSEDSGWGVWLSNRDDRAHAKVSAPGEDAELRAANNGLSRSDGAARESRRELATRADEPSWQDGRLQVTLDGQIWNGQVEGDAWLHLWPKSRNRAGHYGLPDLITGGLEQRIRAWNSVLVVSGGGALATAWAALATQPAGKDVLRRMRSMAVGWDFDGDRTVAWTVLVELPGLERVGGDGRPGSRGPASEVGRAALPDAMSWTGDEVTARIRQTMAEPALARWYGVLDNEALVAGYWRRVATFARTAWQPLDHRFPHLAFLGRALGAWHGGSEANSPTLALQYDLAVVVRVEDSLLVVELLYSDI